MKFKYFTQSVTIKRWGAIFFYATVGATTALPLAKAYLRSIEFIFGGSFELSFNAPSVFWALSTLSLLVWLTAWFKPTPRSLYNSFRFPSGLIAVPLGFFIHVFLFRIEIHYTCGERFLFLAPLAFFVLVVIVCACNERTRKIECEAELDSAEGSVDRLTNSKFIGWLNRKNPIQSSTEDLFNGNDKAQRIASALKETRSGGSEIDRLKTIAVIGPFGVGKTSVIKLAEENLNSDPDTQIFFAHSSCWGFENSAKAQEGILDACVKRLSGEVDCNALRQLPTYYRDAVNESDGWWKPFFVWAMGALTPVTQLERFTPFLVALDARLVIVIEDLDRADFDTSQIVAMLHHLREVRRVSFILAIGQPTPIELFKIADEVVFVEPLLPEQVLAVVDKARSLVLTNPKFIDPEKLRLESQPNRSTPFRPLTLGAYQADVGAAEYLFQAGSMENWPSDLGRLLGSVRNLKGTLKDFLAKWSGLVGEVDPDELLMFCVLRNIVPSIYQFAMDHAVDFKYLGNLRGRSEEHYKKEADALAGKLRERWENACNQTGRERDPAASLLNELFPEFTSIISQIGSGRTSRIQSVSGDRGSVYLRRIHTGECLSSDVSEFTAISLLRQIKNGNAETKVEAVDAILATMPMMSICAILEEELDYLTEENRFLLLSKTLDQIRLKYGRDAWIHSEELGVFRKWLTGGSYQDTVEDWFINEIQRSLPGHAALAAGLIHFAEGRPNPISFKAKLRVIICKQWKDLGLDLFVSEFSGEHGSHVLKFIVLPSFDRSSPLPAELLWLPEKLLSSIEMFPELMVTKAIYCFQGSVEKTNILDFFDTHLVSNFFGKNAMRYYKLIDDNIDKLKTGGDFLSKAREAARYNLD